MAKLQKGTFTGQAGGHGGDIKVALTTDGERITDVKIVEQHETLLKDPQNSLLKQYIALLKADGVSLVFTAEAVDKIAQIAYEVNQGTDNIGARRLATILEKLLEDVLYEGPDMEMGQITVTQAYVEQKLSDIVKNKDLTKFIL